MKGTNSGKRRMGNRLLTSALVSTAAAVVLMGAMADASAQTKIRIMHQGLEQWVKAYHEVGARFMAANPGIELEFIYAPHDAYNEKLGAAIAANDLPDIIELDGPFLSNYVWSGYLRPIEGLISKRTIDDMTASNVSQSTYPLDHKLYATGLFDSSVVLYGNKKYLDAVGARIPKSVDDAWTADEFMQVMEKLSKLPGVKWPIDINRGYGTKTEWITYGYSPLFQSAAGCDLIDRKTWKASGTLDSDTCVKVATFLQSLVEKNWVVPASAGSNQFYAGDRPAALLLSGNWGYGEVTGAGMSPGDVVVMPLPKFGPKGASPNGTFVWAITKNSKNPEAAGKFIDFLMADEGLREAGRKESSFPGMKSFAASSPTYGPGGPMAIAYEQAEKTPVPRPPHPAYPTITLAFQQAMDKIFNKTPANKALTEAAKRIDDDIKDNSGYPPFDKVTQ
jgi:multiple sugar transport system substrate-binding protein